ncbi:hypothetical protein J6590_038449 [Homalodisca vitripennis]|nr:hypothetical protein J6590_038449 [Homalodisca vitripennis]
MEVTETDSPNTNILFREFPKTAGTKLSGRLAAREEWCGFVKVHSNTGVVLVYRGPVRICNIINSAYIIAQANVAMINLRRRKHMSSHAQEGPPPLVGSGTSMYSSLFYQLCGSLRFGVRLATKWQWSGHRASGRVPSSSGGTARGCHHSGGGVFTPPCVN